MRISKYDAALLFLIGAVAFAVFTALAIHRASPLAIGLNGLAALWLLSQGIILVVRK